MFIGHLPAGYVLTKKIQKRTQVDRFLSVGLLASILPDFDLIYFYGFDGHQNLHHSYWIHIPFYWLIIALVTFLMLIPVKKKEYYVLALIFFANVFLHLFLDTIVGKIEWLYPFSEHSYFFFEVPARYSFWVWNFVFHWTFLFEIAVIIWAAFLFLKERKKDSLVLSPTSDKMNSN